MRSASAAGFGATCFCSAFVAAADFFTVAVDFSVVAADLRGVFVSAPTASCGAFVSAAARGDDEYPDKDAANRRTPTLTVTFKLKTARIFPDKR
jgi:hypothetical protein